MRFASFEAFGISIWRMLLVGIAASTLGGLGLWLALGSALGEAKLATLLVVAALIFYVTVSSPRRLFDHQRVSQARESLPLSAAAQACLEVTGSRSKTLMLVRPKEQALSAAVKEAARRILLGIRVEAAVGESSHHLASYSAASVLQSVAAANARGFAGGDEESRGLAVSTELSMETKLPIFMTVCFFAPIMMVLYAVFTHTYQPEQLIELGTLEFAVVDLAYYLSAADRTPQ
jgi:hypothetical protein